MKLIESGEKEKLIELLRERLVECGWRDEMKALCRFGFSRIKLKYHSCWVYVCYLQIMFNVVHGNKSRS